MGQRDLLGSILLQAGRTSDALFFAQAWLEDSIGDNGPPHLGGCDFKVPSSEQMSNDLVEKLSKLPMDAMTYTAALASFKLFGDCPLARQYLRLGAKANPTVLMRISAKIPQPSMSLSQNSLAWANTYSIPCKRVLMMAYER